MLREQVACVREFVRAVAADEAGKSAGERSHLPSPEFRFHHEGNVQPLESLQKFYIFYRSVSRNTV